MNRGGSYSFFLSAIYDGIRDSTEGYSELEIVVNSAPTSGLLVIEPRVGRVHEVLFEFAAVNWIDDAEDLPLKNR